MRNLILPLLLILSVHANASFEEAKSKYAELRQNLDNQIRSIQAEEKVATDPILNEQNKKMAERANCKSFECAVKLDLEIKALSQQYMEASAPFAKRKDECKQIVATEGQLLAVDAYTFEATEFIRASTGAEVFSAVTAESCTDEYPAPSPDMTCKTTTFEYRHYNLFYRTKLSIGIGMLSAAHSVHTLDQMFAMSKDRFLSGVDGQAGYALRRSLVEDFSYNLLSLYYDKAGKYRYLLSTTGIGFKTTVEHTP